MRNGHETRGENSCRRGGSFRCRLTQPFKVRLPGGRIGKLFVGVFRELGAGSGAKQPVIPIHSSH